MAREIFESYITPCEVEDLNKLQAELVQLNIGINQILLVGENLEVRSAIDLMVDEKLLVDSTIANFVDTNFYDKTPIIMDLVKTEFHGKPFHGIKYTGTQELTNALIPEREKGTFQGEVREVFWYRDMIESTPSTPVLRVNIEYTRDTSSFAMFRVVTRTYYNRDGTENSNVRTSMKYYFVNGQDMIDEGVKRRTLLVKSIQIPTMEHIAEVLMPLGVTMENVVLKGRKFMDDYDLFFNNFKNNSSTVTDPLSPDFGMKSVIVKLRDELDADHVEWLDKMPNSLGGSTSIRDHLIAEFSI